MRTIVLFFAMLLGTTLLGQAYNIELVGHVPYDDRGNDIWGYVDAQGREYAIVGTGNSTDLYRLEDPSNPELVYTVPGADGIWRDMKNVGDYLYITTDQGADGLLVIDMTNVDSIKHNFYKPQVLVNGSMQSLDRIHNLYADDHYVYIAGINGVGGVIILDALANPTEPEIVGYTTRAYSHDVYVIDTFLYSSEIYIGELGIYSIADPSNPVLLATQPTTTDFTHNAWTSPDHNFVFTTDERANAFVDSYDITDLSEIRRIDMFQPYRPGAAPSIPHNTHYHNGFLVTSWYEDGLVIMDASRPSNLVEIGSYDTWENPTEGEFNGCWGAYPYLPSGLILANDINSGLYIFRAEYSRAAYFEGLVLDSLTREPVGGATVEILDAFPNRALSGINGAFKTGLAEAGTFRARVRHPEYNTKIVEIQLENGVVTDATVELTQSVLAGSVVALADNSSIANAQVAIVNPETQQAIYAMTDDSGNFSALVDGAQDYEIYAAKWGYKGAKIDAASIDGEPIVVELEEGYQDDFFVDLGWTITSDASAGIWERGVPSGTFDDGTPSNPGMDADSDLGFECYATGNNGGGLGADDVDSGSTILTSPEFEAPSVSDAVIELNLDFSIWFYNCCGSGSPDDELILVLKTADEEYIIDEISQSTAGWEQYSVKITEDDFDLRSKLQFEVQVGDLGDGHIVEAGLDAWNAVFTAIPNSVEEVALEGLQVQPNPISDQLVISHDGEHVEGYVEILDVLGNRMYTDKYTTNMSIATGEWTSGVYFLRIVSNNSTSQTLRVLKQ